MGLHRIDTECYFTVKPDAGTVDCFTVSGNVSLPDGCRAVVGIEPEQLESKPENLMLSDAGFYYFYIYGKGETESFRHTFRAKPYSATGIQLFVKKWFFEGPTFVEIDDAVPTSRIFVLGSCVSRDAFEVNDRNQLLSGYRARTSFATLFDPPMAIDEEQLSANPSAFQRRMVRSDMLKDSFTLASETIGDTVLVDFIDERFDLIKLGDTRISLSPELKKTAFHFSAGQRVLNHDSEYFEAFRTNWLHLVENLPHKQVVVNGVYWSKINDSGDGLPNQDRIEVENYKLFKLYEIIESSTPEVTFIKYNKNDLVADHSHKWGQSPFHYVPSFYEAQNRYLDQVIGQNVD